ncbi:MAG: pyridoxal phosphate-dependent aminotransferase [Tissierellia bacterium]|nr:pyridoxal phosphate-dependent aminotransferase [Tissierellia bacterium]
MKLSNVLNSISESQTLKISSKAKKLKNEGKDIIDLSVGEPDFNTPDYIKKAAINAIDNNFTTYTDVAGIEPLRKAIMENLRLLDNLEGDENNIIVTNGAKEAIYLALKSILDPGDEVLLLDPYFTSYPEMIKLLYANQKIIKSTDPKNPSIKQIEDNITNKTKCIIICSPSNPTGIIYSNDFIRGLAKLIYKKNIFIISDQIYEEINYSKNNNFSIGSIKSVKDLTITINGFSKTYSMTGWRIGYAHANKEIIKSMKKMKSHISSNTNTISQYAALEALEKKNENINLFKQRIKTFEKRRDLIIDLLKKNNMLKLIVPEGAFYMFIDIRKTFGKKIRSQSINNDIDFCNLILQEKEIALTPGSAFGNSNYIRISYAIKEEQLREALNRMLDFINEIK